MLAFLVRVWQKQKANLDKILTSWSGSVFLSVVAKHCHRWPVSCNLTFCVLVLVFLFSTLKRLEKLLQKFILFAYVVKRFKKVICLE